MAGNTFGNIFRLTTFGESHGTAIGGIIDGCPANIQLDLDAIQKQLDRRKPGQSNISTQRKESDTVQFLSGVFEGKTLGTPIGFIIPNDDQRSKDYSDIKNVYRPSHADYTYDKKYGIRDYRGGGRSSARETACRVLAGAIADQVLALKGISITAFVNRVGSIEMNDSKAFSREDVDRNDVRCPDAEVAERMIAEIKQTKKEGDSLGGQVHCVISGMLVGIGEPVFDRLNADLAKAMFSINAVKGFELGSGFQGSRMRGSQHNDAFEIKENQVATKSNNSGGIQGGISNGEDIYFNVAFKPTATISKSQDTVDNQSNAVEMSAKGRHDPCIVPRAVPIVEAMTSIVILDQILRSQSNKLAD